jgi:hypothetical protein
MSTTNPLVSPILPSWPHVGEFLTGTMAEVRAKVPVHAQHKKGLHDVIEDESMPTIPINYSDPTQILPVKPPPSCDSCDEPMCENCAVLEKWWSEYDDIVDDLI